MDKVKEYINSLNQMIKNGKEPPINIVLNPEKQIEKVLFVLSFQDIYF